MLKYSKKATLSGAHVTFKYSVLSATLSIEIDGEVFSKHLIWLPWHNIEVPIGNELYDLRVITLPLNIYTLKLNSEVIISELFPKLRYASIATFFIGLVKRVLYILPALF